MTQAKDQGSNCSRIIDVPWGEGRGGGFNGTNPGK